VKGFMLTLLLIASAAAAADVRWVYYPEAVPATLPGASLEPTGVLVQITSTADNANVCVGYTTHSDNAKRSACVTGSQNVRVNLGTSTGDYSVDAISVTAGGVTKSVASPQAATEY
jgi:hypothetical protein